MREATPDDLRAFVRDSTTLTAVPFVPEIRVYTATEVTPLWHKTSDWLAGTSFLPPPDTGEVPFWSAPWAGGQAIARHVLDHPELVRGKRVIDFGTGSGLVAIAAALAGAAHVVGLDVDRLAVTAALLNAEANGVAIEARIEDVVGQPHLEADLFLAGDIWYEREAAARFEPWLRALSEGGLHVLTGDPGRAYVPSSYREVASYEVVTSPDLESSRVRTTRVLRP